MLKIATLKIESQNENVLNVLKYLVLHIPHCDKIVTDKIKAWRCDCLKKPPQKTQEENLEMAIPCVFQDGVQ